METKERTKVSKASKKPKNNKATLVVKAHDLYKLPPTTTNVDNCTELIDEDGCKSGYGKSKKNFETTVFMNYKMTWDIEAADKNGIDKGYDVQLVSITHNPTPGNPNFFNHNPLVPGSNKKTIEGTISNSPLLPDLDDSYKIHFRITHNGVPKDYPMDPKLRINPGN